MHVTRPSDFTGPQEERQIELRDILDARDVGTSVCTREIRRSIEVLRYVASARPSELIQTRPPDPTGDLVTVVVPAYNSREWIVDCVKSLLLQTHHNLEIFCVDDGSDDDTYDRVVGEFRHEARLCAVRLGRNVGPYQIKNWVIDALARGRVIAMQDADDISHPSRIEKQWSWMRTNGYRVGGICMHQFFPPHIEPDKIHTIRISADGAMHDLALYETAPRLDAPVGVMQALLDRAGCRFVDENGKVRHAARNGSVAIYGAQMIERSLCLEFGGFDGRTRITADREFNWRVLRYHPVGNLPLVLYSRRYHDASLTRRSDVGKGSAPRVAFDRKMKRAHERIRQVVERGDAERLRALCTSDLFYGDIEVEEFHTGFDVPPLSR